MFHSLHRPELLYSGLMSQWVFSLVTDKLNVTIQIAERISQLAQNQNDAALAVIGAEDTQIEASFCAGIRIAKERKSVSLEKRAEATYAEYRRQKTSGLGGRGFRLPV